MATDASETSQPQTQQMPSAEQPRRARAIVRLAAGLIDLVIMGIPAILLVSIFMDVKADPNKSSIESLFSTANVLQAVVILVATVLMLVNWDGRTPGKKIMKIRIVSDPGYGDLSYGKATLRSLLSLTGALTLLLGYIVMGIMIAMRPDRRGYHDMIAKTCVIHDKKR